MGQPAVSALAPLPLDFELVTSDGEPLESEWHTYQFPLLRTLIHQVMAEQRRGDYFVGGDMFVYYSVEQARDVAKGRRYFRGPDVFWVGGVEPAPLRDAWVSWEEDGRLPDLIVELLSPSTAEIDRNEKMDIYSRIFKTAEYYLYEPETLKLEGNALAGQTYRPVAPDSRGWLWSEQLGVFLGLWHGVFEGQEGDWVRLFRPDGTMVPTPEERVQTEQQRAEAERRRAEAEGQRAEAERRRAEAEGQRAEAERQQAQAERLRAEAERLRAETAEAELARLRALLGQDQG